MQEGRDERWSESRGQAFVRSKGAHSRCDSTSGACFRISSSLTTPLPHSCQLLSWDNFTTYFYKFSNDIVESVRNLTYKVDFQDSSFTPLNE